MKKNLLSFWAVLWILNILLAGIYVSNADAECSLRDNGPAYVPYNYYQFLDGGTYNPPDPVSHGCDWIGTWDQDTKTFTLGAAYDLNHYDYIHLIGTTLYIEGDGITLDGSGLVNSYYQAFITYDTGLNRHSPMITILGNDARIINTHFDNSLNEGINGYHEAYKESAINVNYNNADEPLRLTIENCQFNGLPIYINNFSSYNEDVPGEQEIKIIGSYTDDTLELQGHSFLIDNNIIQSFLHAYSLVDSVISNNFFIKTDYGDTYQLEVEQGENLVIANNAFPFNNITSDSISLTPIFFNYIGVDLELAGQNGIKMGVEQYNDILLDSQHYDIVGEPVRINLTRYDENASATIRMHYDNAETAGRRESNFALWYWDFYSITGSEPANWILDTTNKHLSIDVSQIDYNGNGISYTDGSIAIVEALDQDDDNVVDIKDNCEQTFNPDQLDSDGNGIGDACQDSDGDGIIDSGDNCPGVPNGPDLGTCVDPTTVQYDYGSNCTEECLSPCFAQYNFCLFNQPAANYCNDIYTGCKSNCNSNPNACGENSCDLVQLDTDGDGSGNPCDLCEGNDAAGDSDGDGICDDIDTCLGDNTTGDSDDDGFCDDNDNCPTTAQTSQSDTDGDGIGDVCDVCQGSNATDDSDGDGVCDDLDVCQGIDTTGDSDGDGICDDEDVCIGNDTTGDTDGDGICNDLDICQGEDATGDTDGDGICNNIDVCLGVNATGDTDGDGICDDTDTCPGGDDSLDSDNDGVCDFNDVCRGNDSSGDRDGDGICDDEDVCIGNDTTGDTDGDGICSDIDCNDANASVNPGATETCDDGIDNNCDGVESITPLITSFIIPLDPIAAGNQITANSEFTDDNSSDEHMVSWNWGDGDTYTYPISGVRYIEESHTFSIPGIFTVTMSVSDDYCGGDLHEYQYVVVYDPNSGFVTGGGWIMSPEGAYNADLTLTDKANFGFISKYKKGATVPTGTTEFQFKVADLNFHSENYEWLVVAGASAKFKGTGTINGLGDYKFVLSAIDANMNVNDAFETDRFRIKIWTEDNGTEVVIYDNALGDNSDEATTEISGGAIVIHTGKGK